MKEEIITWLKEGCNIQNGVALYFQYGDNAGFKVLLQVDPVPVALKLKLLLCRLAGISASDYTGAIRELEKDKFRKMYPFLADADCPYELKALASDKITTYWKIVELHEKLFSCHANSDCLAVASELVYTFLEDRLIKQELDYYKQYGGILGKHKIFADQKRIKVIRNMNVKQLIRKEKQLKDNIWRINSEIAKMNKPHLITERQKRLEEKSKELKIVQNMLGDD